MSHGQTQVERVFSFSNQLLDDNMLTDTLVTQRIVHDHMCSENLKSSQLVMTTKLMGHVKDARTLYFSNQKESCLKALKTDRDTKQININKKIISFDEQIHTL